jgi:hypothetical protein
MNEETRDEIDKAIDRATRAAVSGELSPRLQARIMAGLDGAQSRQGVAVRWAWLAATAAVALILGVWVTVQSPDRGVTPESRRVVRADSDGASPRSPTSPKAEPDDTSTPSINASSHRRGPAPVNVLATAPAPSALSPIRVDIAPVAIAPVSIPDVAIASVRIDEVQIAPVVAGFQ